MMYYEAGPGAIRGVETRWFQVVVRGLKNAKVARDESQPID